MTLPDAYVRNKICVLVMHMSSVRNVPRRVKRVVIVADEAQSRAERS